MLDTPRICQYKNQLFELYCMHCMQNYIGSGSHRKTSECQYTNYYSLQIKFEAFWII